MTSAEKPTSENQSVARALAVRPAILRMDEPLSALDSQIRELLMEDFVRLLAERKAIRNEILALGEETASLSQ